MTVALWCSLPVAGAFRYPECGGAVDPVTVASVSDLITVDSVATVESTRTALQQYIWGSGGMPEGNPGTIDLDVAEADFASLPNVDQIDRYTHVPAFSTTMQYFHFRNTTPNGRLAIYVQGHVGDGVKYPHAMYSMGRLLSAGYDVIGCALPFFGAYQSTGTYNGNPLTGHDDLWIPQADIAVLGYSPVVLFVDLIARSLNLVASEYDGVLMTGYSGGGWTTTLMAALDPRIMWSYPVSGSLPWFTRDPANSGEVGDFEQIVAGLYDIATYEDLYVIGAHGTGRRQLQILSTLDSIFAAANLLDYQNAIALRVAEIGAGRWSGIADPTHVLHQISPAAMATIIDDAADQVSP